MPRAGLNPQVVVRAAAQLADEVGYDRLTLAELANRLGVALPSLYKHVKGADALMQKLSTLATAELAAETTTAAAGRSGADALRVVAHAYRSYAHRHPGRYVAAQRAPDPSDPEHVAVAERAVGVAYAVLAGYGISGTAAVDAARMFRAALHGFVSLEAMGGFGLPRDVDRSFDQLIAALDMAYRAWPSTSAQAGELTAGP
ncbi:TetR/AcrR family transcriptional regulator [Micromonospora endophytica]|uniref:TetR family transcriptional regulator n=1 Tax=Micromonospora endophytica TaxID=515350 RepID=A0A2W2CFL5_9ACTN|nr:TetR/AcrR family transcriptional regulator [Micromonospora endophytica]PZF98171.1 TetR family transcriptional regulator [Micromonospora endophytica]RIW48809.1 TetR family transcriptional regulator [Micromonospora endophytica]BCJ60041.1 transcriptional regulator [Micromonospora endophytica]